jgi:hypothetical protein
VLVIDDKPSSLENEIKKKASEDAEPDFDEETIVLDESMTWFQNFYQLYWD